MKSKVPTILLIFFSLSTFVSVLVRIYVASSVSVKGEDVSKLEQELEILKEENKKLELDIAKESSLLLIQQRATELGMAQAQNKEFLTPIPTASVESERF